MSPNNNNDDDDMVMMDADAEVEDAVDIDLDNEPVCHNKKECQEIVNLLLTEDIGNDDDAAMDGGDNGAGGGGSGYMNLRQVSESTAGGGGGSGHFSQQQQVVVEDFDENLNYFDVDADIDDIDFSMPTTNPTDYNNGDAAGGPAPPPASVVVVAAANGDGNKADATSSPPSGLKLTGRPGIPLYLSCNPDHLSVYQTEIRKHIQFFEATEVYVNSNEQVKGRNKAIVLGQVGIQCCHCAYIFPLSERSRGNMYFPQKLLGIYQASQILSTNHLLDSCTMIPSSIRNMLKEYQQQSNSTATQKSSTTATVGLVGSYTGSTPGGRAAGKDYWSRTAQALGVYEDEYGLRFKDRLPTYQELKDLHDKVQKVDEQQHHQHDDDDSDSEEL